MKKSIKLIFLVFTVFLLSCQESAIKSAVVSGNKGVVYDSKNDLVL